MKTFEAEGRTNEKDLGMFKERGEHGRGQLIRLENVINGNKCRKLEQSERQKLVCSSGRNETLFDTISQACYFLRWSQGEREKWDLSLKEIF